jgi:hypothetical protein
MKRIWNLFITVAISLETLVTVGYFLLYMRAPQVFYFLGAQIRGNDESIKFLALVPVTMLGLVIHGRKDLLFPDHPKNNLLQEWPEYYHILDRYWVTVFFGGVCILLSVGIWVLHLPLTNPEWLSIFMCSISVSTVTYFSFLNATIQVRRILSNPKRGK